MALLLILLAAPLGLYLVSGRGRGPVWGLLPAGEELRGGGAYRQTRVKAWRRGAAPRSVRLAALSSFFLGQMIVPGVLAGLLGLLVLAESGSDAGGSLLLVILLLSVPTGVLVAWYLLAAGSAMLGRADGAAPKARRAASWALGHNLVLLVALGVGAAAQPDEAWFAVGPALYACFSVAQALLMQRAAGAFEAYAALQDGDPAPLEAELEILGRVR